HHPRGPHHDLRLARARSTHIPTGHRRRAGREPVRARGALPPGDRGERVHWRVRGGLAAGAERDELREEAALAAGGGGGVRREGVFAEGGCVEGIGDGGEGL
ncbi:MAG: hypothetical protein M1833_001124, partial [Piccolia ochrophora]